LTHVLPTPIQGAPQTISADLSTGTIEVDIGRSLISPDCLFGFAERRNPKRSFLFVSRVLGRHIPVRPSSIRNAFNLLAAQIPTNLPRPILVIGMAETAVGLGAGVHRAYAGEADDVVYLSTTRHALGTPLVTEFHEEHSHATLHLLHEPVDPRTAMLVREARSLVLVDDEMSTGKTFVNLSKALKDPLKNVEQIVLATLTDWSDGKALDAIGSRASSVSLLTGRYRWTPRDGAVLPDMPHVDVTGRGEYELDPTLDWARLGVRRHSARLAALAQTQPGERILVLGTGEHVWEPFQLAEAFEKAGADVRFSAVTRSPIALGHTIERLLAFSDNYGLGIANFVYNIDPDSYDRIVLCSETPVQAIDPVLIGALRPHIISDKA
jgi:hypothetical protein